MKMNETQKFIFLVAAVYLRRKRRSIWVHETIRARRQHGEYHRLVQELRLDEVRFQQYQKLLSTHHSFYLCPCTWAETYQTKLENC